MVYIDLEEISCYSCGVLFFITKKNNDKLLRTKKTFYCPNGHFQSYTGKTDKQLLEEEKEKSKRNYNYYLEELKIGDKLRTETRTLKGNITKLKKEKPKEKIIHSFGKTNPNAKCYKNMDNRTPTCGISVKKEFVTNKIEKVTCKRCLKLEKK